ncbi:ABC transporter permease [Dactylosporangium sp. CA-233914]|uniref:ABC transporter permease n=1 Tax=Dactylosporangium sp. CA-233914 TaxID=3239934 RepID=UPI003D94A80F
MKAYLLARVLRAIMTIWVVLTIVFFLSHLSGDPTQWLLPDDASARDRAALRASLGLDRPIWQQYWDYLVGLSHGRMGTSYAYHRPVSDLFLQRAPYTVALGGLALLVAVVAGIALGTLAATKRGTVIDRLSMTSAVGGEAIPDFALGILLVLVFSLTLHVLPSGGYSSPQHYILPVVTLAAGATTGVARWTRGAMVDVLGQDYLETARAKGIGEVRVVLKHAMRNSLIPVVTVLGLQLGTLIGGAVVVETVFGWPGVGSLIVAAAQSRDLPVIQFGVLVVAGTVVFASLLVDLSYALLDPRIRIHA